jgi:hypothetical protein
MGQTDSVNILAYVVPIVSAFFGASAAFALGVLREKSHKRTKQLDTINAAIYGLVMTAEALVNLKKQFLIEHNAQFAEATKVLSGVSTTMGGEEIRRAASAFYGICQEISKKDESLNGAFKKWQDCEFPILPNPMDLTFTVAGAPELIRLLLLAKNETDQVSKRVVERNVLWLRHESTVMNEAKTETPTLEGLIFRYEILDLRAAICTYVDTALVVIFEALDQLTAYRKTHFRQRNKLAGRIFGKKQWVSYKIDDKWKPLIPDRKAYAGIIWSVNDSSSTRSN